MINYIYNQLNNLQGWFVIVSDCEELVGWFNRKGLFSVLHVFVDQRA